MLFIVGCTGRFHLKGVPFLHLRYYSTTVYCLKGMEICWFSMFNMYLKLKESATKSKYHKLGNTIQYNNIYIAFTCLSAKRYIAQGQNRPFAWLSHLIQKSAVLDGKIWHSGTSKNNGNLFIFYVPLRHLPSSSADFAPRDQVMQRAYFG